MLDDRQRDAGRVDLLERVAADQLAANLAGDADERRRVHPRVGDRRHEVRRAGARGRDRNAWAARGARVTLGHVAGALLVAREDMTNGRAARDRVVGRKNRPARDAEGNLDPFGLEGAKNRV